MYNHLRTRTIILFSIPHTLHLLRHNDLSMLLLPYREDGNNTGNNVDSDKGQEICNCATKSVVQGMGANKIANGIITASQAAHGVQQIKTRFHHLNKVHPQSQAHSTRSFHDNKKLMFQGLEEIMLLPSIGQTAAMKVSKILKSRH